MIFYAKDVTAEWDSYMFPSTVPSDVRDSTTKLLAVHRYTIDRKELRVFVSLQISFQVVSHCLKENTVLRALFSFVCFFPDVNNIFIFVCQPLEL